MEILKKSKIWNLFLAFLIVVITVPAPVFAQEEADSGFMLGIDRIDGVDDVLDDFGEVSPLGIEMGFTLTSAYMWRGQKLGGDTSWQPYVSASTKDWFPVGTLSYTWWLNLTKSAPDRDDTEHDNVWDYTVNVGDLIETLGGSPSENSLLNPDFSTGFIHYYFPPAGNMTNEWYWGFSWGDILLSPSLTWYHDWVQGSGEWIDFRLSHDVEIEGVTIATYASLGYNHKQWNGNLGTESGFAVLDFGASLPIPLGDHMTIEPFLSYTKRLQTFRAPGGADLLEDELYGGFNYSISF